MNRATGAWVFTRFKASWMHADGREGGMSSILQRQREPRVYISSGVM